MTTKLTSWNNASVSSGSVVNECQFVYNTFGQLITDYQEHGGAVNTSTSPKVQYGYANGSANTIRPTTLTYPNGRVLTYGYGTTNGIDDAISRVSSLIDNDGTTHLADYSFVGMGAYVVVDYTQPDVKYTLVDLSGTNDPDTGDIYSGWDRFGRVKDCRWYDYGHSTDTARLKYGYDRASDRLWRADTVAQSFGENFDELNSYDGLHQLKEMQRGLLNGSKTAISSENFAQCWSLDPTGNWRRFLEDGNGDGVSDLSQSRTGNTVNEITNITNSVGPSWITPDYDAAGNMTTMPQPASPTQSYTAMYDAWNRLVKVSTGATTVSTYTYDAAKRRVLQNSYSSGVFSEGRHIYYTEPDKWQPIEERLGLSTSAQRQFVWGMRYVDDLTLRDRDTTGGGMLNERLYCLADANWNVIAVSDPTGTVQERCNYAGYGMPTFLSNTFIPLAASSYGWETLYAGYRWEATSQFYHVRNRVLHALLGVWTSRDPIGYEDSLNLYSYATNRPTIAVDPSGTIGVIVVIVVVAGVLLLYPNEAGAPGGGDFVNPSDPSNWVYGGLVGASLVCPAGSLGRLRQAGCLLGELPAIQISITTACTTLVSCLCISQIGGHGEKPKGPCEFYLAWCQFGVTQGKGKWTRNLSECDECYTKCLSNGGTSKSWPFSKCPIAGPKSNPKGPRWPDPDEKFPWSPQWPD